MGHYRMDYILSILSSANSKDGRSIEEISKDTGISLFETTTYVSHLCCKKNSLTEENGRYFTTEFARKTLKLQPK